MITGIFGATGTGKSTLLKRIVKRAPRAIVVDPLGKLGHLGRCVGSLSVFKSFWKSRFRSEWTMVLQPARIAPDQSPRDALAPFVTTAFQVARKGAPPFLVAVDEADAFGSPGAPDPALRMIADYGRNFGVSLMFVARRPACIDRTLTANAGTLYIYRITEGRDLEYFSGILSPDAVAVLPTLETFQALRWRGAGQPADIISTAPDGASASAPTVKPTGESVPAADPEPVPTPTDPWAAGSRVIGLGELARAYGYSDTTKFRKTRLDTGAILSQKISARRYRIPLDSLPGEKVAPSA